MVASTALLRVTLAVLACASASAEAERKAPGNVSAPALRGTAVEAAKAEGKAPGNVSAPALRGGTVEAAKAAAKDSLPANSWAEATLAAMAVSAATGACSAADAARLAQRGGGNAPGSFPAVVAACGRSAWGLLTGFNEEKYTSCIARDVGLGAGCSRCWAAPGQSTYRRCKFSCLFGSWCSHRCLRCVEPAVGTVRNCAGVPLPAATPC